MPLTSLICINGKKHLTEAALINARGALGLSGLLAASAWAVSESCAGHGQAEECRRLGVLKLGVEGCQRHSDSPLPSGSSQSDGGGPELALKEIPVC